MQSHRNENPHKKNLELFDGSGTMECNSNSARGVYIHYEIETLCFSLIFYYECDEQD